MNTPDSKTTDERLDDEEWFFVKGLLLFPIIGLMAIVGRRMKLSGEAVKKRNGKGV